ncbi:MAG TPA: ABC transporter ATP-binding protein [Planctomycetota bacterium]|nr:ABC transporter ATP-binding protein [Planctomycetota bacterium]
MPLLSVTDVTYAYPDGRKAVEDVSFSIESGHSVALLGPNGAGKTTLLLILAGMLRPDRGDVVIGGKRYGGEDDSAVRRHLGFVFQETEDQLFSATVFDDVAFGPLNFGMSAAEARRRVTETLASVGLTGYENRVPHHLSSGERRRTALATVLSYDPDILILDEPSNDLDARGCRDLVRLLRATRQARIIASHDIEFVLRTCDHAMVIDGGRIAARGPAADILCDRELLGRHGLEAPLGLRNLSPAALRDLLSGDA